ncbi:MAG: hypothetical protein A2Z29_05505 [Chloroflexi bacterium RBG_16_56_11]|nr:MAG: hypothetical protein A2Z29_05505 [Chloroflexi bacterium RBG_16_56_11]
MRAIITALKIWLGIIRNGTLIVPLGITWGLIGAYDLVSNQFFNDKWPKISNVLPDWGWQSWAIMGLLFLLAISVQGTYKKERTKLSSNWISAYQIENSKLPPIQDYFVDLTINYTKGEPISREIKLRPMSAQFWARLFPSQRDELKQLVEWLGMNWDDYYEQMQRMLPKPNPKQAKNRPFEQH